MSDKKEKPDLGPELQAAVVALDEALRPAEPEPDERPSNRAVEPLQRIAACESAALPYEPVVLTVLEMAMRRGRKEIQDPETGENRERRPEEDREISPLEQRVALRALKEMGCRPQERSDSRILEVLRFYLNGTDHELRSAAAAVLFYLVSEEAAQLEWEYVRSCSSEVTEPGQPSPMGKALLAWSNRSVQTLAYESEVVALIQGNPASLKEGLWALTMMGPRPLGHDDSKLLELIDKGLREEHSKLYSVLLLGKLSSDRALAKIVAMIGNAGTSESVALTLEGFRKGREGVIPEQVSTIRALYLNLSTAQTPHRRDLGQAICGVMLHHTAVRNTWWKELIPLLISDRFDVVSTKALALVAAFGSAVEDQELIERIEKILATHPPDCVRRVANTALAKLRNTV